MNNPSPLATARAIAHLTTTERGLEILRVLVENVEAFVSLDMTNQASTETVVSALVQHWARTRDMLDAVKDPVRNTTQQVITQHAADLKPDVAARWKEKQ